MLIEDTNQADQPTLPQETAVQRLDKVSKIIQRQGLDTNGHEIDEQLKILLNAKDEEIRDLKNVIEEQHTEFSATLQAVVYLAETILSTTGTHHDKKILVTAIVETIQPRLLTFKKKSVFEPVRYREWLQARKYGDIHCPGESEF